VARADVALIDYQGYSFETGGFLPSNPGDVLTVVGVVDNLDTRFNIDLLTHEVTLVAGGLTSVGQVDVGGGLLSISYTGGTLDLYDDSTPDHDYGVNPPNGTVPSTFTDGALFLGGAFDSFFLMFDTATGTGVYEGYLTFTAGTGLAALNEVNSPGYTFGGLLSVTAVGPQNIPVGYDMQADGQLQVGRPVAVQPMNWGSVKEMYRP
jgi:hypothetical protein